MACCHQDMDNVAPEMHNTLYTLHFTLTLSLPLINNHTLAHTTQHTHFIIGFLLYKTDIVHGLQCDVMSDVASKVVYGSFVVLTTREHPL